MPSYTTEFSNAWKYNVSLFIYVIFLFILSLNFFQQCSVIFSVQAYISVKSIPKKFVGFFDIFIIWIDTLTPFGELFLVRT